jgi:hypothetical protein
VKNFLCVLILIAFGVFAGNAISADYQSYSFTVATTTTTTAEPAHKINAKITLTPVDSFKLYFWNSGTGADSTFFLQGGETNAGPWANLTDALTVGVGNTDTQQHEVRNRGANAIRLKCSSGCAAGNTWIVNVIGWLNE